MYIASLELRHKNSNSFIPQTFIEYLLRCRPLLRDIAVYIKTDGAHGGQRGRQGPIGHGEDCGFDPKNSGGGRRSEGHGIKICVLGDHSSCWGIINWKW